MDDGILLIGDAAGLASPQSGEGIRPAIESGLMAADVLQRCQKGYDKAQLQEYQQKILDRFGPWLDKPAESIVPAPLRRFLGRHLMSTHWFTRNILLGRWFLQQHLPPLVRN